MMIHKIRSAHVIRKLAIRHRLCFRQTSTQAWSRASGSKEANIPIFADRTSFSPWQSQFGETSITREIWKFGLPSITAFVYSAILQFKIALALLFLNVMASKLHAPSICYSLHNALYLQSFSLFLHRIQVRRWHIPSDSGGSPGRAFP